MYKDLSPAELNGLFSFVGKAAKKVGKAAGKAAPYAAVAAASYATGNPALATGFVASKASGQGTKASLQNAILTANGAMPPSAGSPLTEPTPQYGSPYVPSAIPNLGDSGKLPEWTLPAAIAGGLVLFGLAMRK